MKGKDKPPTVECEKCKVYDFNYQKLLKEVGRLKASNIYWKRRARELKIQVEKYVKR